MIPTIFQSRQQQIYIKKAHNDSHNNMVWILDVLQTTATQQKTTENSIFTIHTVSYNLMQHGYILAVFKPHAPCILLSILCLQFDNETLVSKCYK